WVLHNAPATTTFKALVKREGKPLELTLALENGWRRGNISWRATTWQLRQMGLGGMELDSLDDSSRRQAQIKGDRMAIKIAHVGEYGEHAIAKRAGLAKGDIIVSFDGLSRQMTESQLLDYALRQKRPGDSIAVEVIRAGARRTFTYLLPLPAAR